MNKHRESRKRLNDEIRDIAVKPVVKKAKKIDTLSVINDDYGKKSSQKLERNREGEKSSLEITAKFESESKEKVKAQNGHSSLSDIEREKLRERVKRIAMKLGTSQDKTKEREHHHKKKKKHKKKYAKFEGK